MLNLMYYGVELFILDLIFLLQLLVCAIDLNHNAQNDSNLRLEKKKMGKSRQYNISLIEVVELSVSNPQ